jgi:hypothetical protein
MLQTQIPTRERIIPYKHNQKPNSVCRKGIFIDCLTGNEQGEVGEGFAMGTLSGYPRYIQNVTKAADGCPYDIVASLVCLGKVVTFQVKTTGNKKYQLTGNNYNSNGSHSTLPNLDLIDAIIIVHSDPRIYIVPMKIVKRHPVVIRRLTTSSNSPIRYVYDKIYANFEIIGKKTPEIFKYKDYWE